LRKKKEKEEHNKSFLGTQVPSSNTLVRREGEKPLGNPGKP